jgi:preprotein translocase subunit YajC
LRSTGPKGAEWAAAVFIGFAPHSWFHKIDLGVENILPGISSGVTGGLAFWLQLPGGTSLLGLAPLLFIFAIFYFLLILPQQRKQKKWQAMLGELKNGDRIVTSGGLRGTIVSLKDDALVLRVPPDNLKLEISRASVVSVTTAEEGIKS